MIENKEEGLSDMMFFNKKIIQEMLDRKYSLREIGEMEICEMMIATKTLHFVLQEIITPKFLELDDNQIIEQEKSAFDDYDEENGYNDEEKQDIWKVCLENTDRVISLAIKILNNSYTDCLETDIEELLDHMKFAIRTINERQ